MYIGEVEIGKREVIFSSIILSVMIVIGILISGAIQRYSIKDFEVYNKALKIENNSDQFKYGMKTNIGNALVYGDLKGIDGVSMPELTNKYIYVAKCKEVYTRHTRTVTHTDGDKTWTTTEVYYTWDNHGETSIKVKKIDFLGVIFNSNKISIDSFRLGLNEKTVSKKYLDKVKWDYIYEDSRFWENEGDVRYDFQCISLNQKGFVFGNLKNNDIIGNLHLEEKTISKYIQEKKDGVNTGSTIFWIFWIILIIIVIGLFYMADNYWLED